MTLDEFFDKLQQRQQRYGFTFVDNAIRERETNLCPVCAVCEMICGVTTDNINADYAAHLIELEAEAFHYVVNSADGRYNNNTLRKVLGL